MNSAIIVQKLWNCCNALRDDLFDHDRHTLERPGAGQGSIVLIFGKAQNRFHDPAKLRRLVLTAAGPSVMVERVRNALDAVRAQFEATQNS